MLSESGAGRAIRPRAAWVLDTDALKVARPVVDRGGFGRRGSSAGLREYGTAARGRIGSHIGSRRASIPTNTSLRTLREEGLTMKALRIVSLAALGGLLIVLAAPPAAAADAKVIKIYESWPMQGSMIPEGTAMANAAKMALDEVKGQVAGYKIEFVFLDDASPITFKYTATTEANNAQKA